MHFIAFSVLCSVVVSVLLKLARRHDIDVNQAIAVNYLVAAALTMGVFQPAPGTLFLPQAIPAWPLILGLAVLLPAIFAVLAVSVRKAGIVRTDAAQRLSLLLPLLAAFTLFGEALTWSKAAGIAIGLLAIACLLQRRRVNAAAADVASGKDAWWPLAVFVGMGAIDIGFKQVARLSAISFASILCGVFVLAFALSAIVVGVLIARGKASLRWRHLAGGVLLGLFNFANIAFYVEAHRALPRDPALVFASMNIGVIALATLVGVGLFGERLNHWNRAGLLLAITAVVVIAL